MEESKDCNVVLDIDVLFRRRRKRRKIFREGEYLFFWRKRKPEKEKEENIWRRKFFVEERKDGVGKGGKYLEKRNGGNFSEKEN